MSAPGETQDERRKEIVGGTVSATEKERIDLARQRAGVKTMSEFVRETMLARADLVLRPKRKQDVAA